MDTNTYWTVRSKAAELKKSLAKMSREQLEASIFNAHYNDFLRSRSDYSDTEEDKHGHGKCVPYIGWFWRHVDFWSGHVPIGDCGKFIGFMENNKWDYPQRDLTAEEIETIIAIIDAAMEENQQGGNLADIIAKTNAKIDELWDYMQTLQV